MPDYAAAMTDDILGSARGRVVLGDNLAVLPELPDESVDLIYVDPPFNTGQRQAMRRMKTVRDRPGLALSLRHRDRHQGR